MTVTWISVAVFVLIIFGGVIGLLRSRGSVVAVSIAAVFKSRR